MCSTNGYGSRLYTPDCKLVQKGAISATNPVQGVVENVCPYATFHKRYDFRLADHSTIWKSNARQCRIPQNCDIPVALELSILAALLGWVRSLVLQDVQVMHPTWQCFR